MPMLLAFTGLFSFLLLWPCFFILNASGYEVGCGMKVALMVQVFEWPQGNTWLYLLLNSMLGTVLSEVLWLWATLVGLLMLSMLLMYS